MIDWQAGDLAMCAHHRDWCPHGGERLPDKASVAESMFFPQVGETYRVYEVVVFGPHVHGAEDEGDLIYLRIDGFVPFFDARLFVKCTPAAAEFSLEEGIDLPLDKPVTVPA